MITVIDPCTPSRSLASGLSCGDFRTHFTLQTLCCLLLGHVKKKNWLAPFFQKFYGRKGGFFIFIIFYFQAEVLMLKYNKTYHYLLSFLHPSVQTYCITHIKHHIGMQKTKIFGQLIQKCTKFCRRKIVLKHFKRKTMKIKKKLSRALFQWSGGDANRFFFFTWPYGITSTDLVDRR